MLDEQTIKANLEACERRVKELHRAREAFNKNLDRKIQSVMNEVSDIQSQCDHIDDGGMFYSTCKICGYSDGL